MSFDDEEDWIEQATKSLQEILKDETLKLTVETNDDDDRNVTILIQWAYNHTKWGGYLSTRDICFNLSHYPSCCGVCIMHCLSTGDLSLAEWKLIWPLIEQYVVGRFGTPNIQAIVVDAQLTKGSLAWFVSKTFKKIGKCHNERHDTELMIFNHHIENFSEYDEWMDF